MLHFLLVPVWHNLAEYNHHLRRYPKHPSQNVHRKLSTIFFAADVNCDAFETTQFAQEDRGLFDSSNISEITIYLSQMLQVLFPLINVAEKAQTHMLNSSCLRRGEPVGRGV